MDSIDAGGCHGLKDAAIEADATAFLLGRLSHTLSQGEVDEYACAAMCAGAVLGIARVMRACGVSEGSFEAAASMLGGGNGASCAILVKRHAFGDETAA